MAYHNTIFAQMLKFIPRHEFESLAHQYHCFGRLSNRLVAGCAR